jgi:hypothetical protein
MWYKGSKETPENFFSGLIDASPIELHLSAKKPLLSPIEISRMYADVLCLSCTLRPYHATQKQLSCGTAVRAFDYPSPPVP